MNTRLQSIREDCHTVPRRSKRLKKISESENGIEDSLPLPMDLILEIFSRLSAKSLAICRCVSKPWATVLRRPDFTDLFLTKSWARPQILFACRKWSNKTSLFSSPQPQNADEYSSPLVVNPLTHIPLNGLVERVTGSFVSRIGGLLGLVEERHYMETRNYRHVFYNPSTRRSLTLPNVKTTETSKVRSYFGYDPVAKLFKVLSMTVDWSPFGDRVCTNHKVLTLGSEKPQWRMIECGIPHSSLCGQRICINGVLYYPATHMILEKLVMVCFDVRCEKFSYFEVTDPYVRILMDDGPLMVYNDKLAFLQSDESGSYLDENSTSIELIVIGDSVKQEWSKHTYVLPPSWKMTVGKCLLWNIRFVGVTRTNDIVLLLTLPRPNRFYLFFYSMERSTFTRVEIKGMNVDYRYEIQVFLDHVEDLKLIGG